jgi:hypothetical protein
MDAVLSEPISPELVLVTPELRSWAITELWAAEARAALAQRRAADVAPPASRERSRSLAAQLLLYAGWQALTGAVFGLGAFLVFIALLLLKPFLGG